MPGEEKKPKKPRKSRKKKKTEKKSAAKMVVEEVKPEEKPKKIGEKDFVLVDYVVRVEETGELVETTLEEEAKKSGVEVSGQTFEPKLVIPGRGLLLKAIEDEIIGMEEGEEKRFTIPPERGFGLRDPSKVRVIPLRKLKDVEGPITIGSRITIDGKEGIVRSIGSGRVQVDFNPYLAGKHLDCYIKIVKLIVDDAEKVKALLHSRLPDIEKEKFTVEFEKPEVRVTIPQEAFLLPALQVSKRVVAKDIIDNIDGVEKVIYVENYTKGLFQ